MPPQSHDETLPPTPRAAKLTADDARSVIISVNPRAGSRARHDHVDAIEHALSARGFEVEIAQELDGLREKAAILWRDGRMRAVVAVGGDGTSSLVRAHVPLEVPLVPLPLGTENLLAHYIGQSADPAAVCRTIEDGVLIELDMGKAGDRLFLLMISAGFDAEVIRRLHENRRGNITRRSYYLPTLRTIGGYGYPEMQLYCHDSATAGDVPLGCRWLFGFNLPLYALGIPIAPDAEGTDGLLDVYTLQRGGVVSVARYLWHVLRGRHSELADVAVSRCRRFRLEAPGRIDVAYQLDGDFAGMLPVDVDLLPGQLRLLVSRDTAGRLGFALPAGSAGPREPDVGK